MRSLDKARVCGVVMIALTVVHLAAGSSVEDLKSLSIEDLMEIKVRSVSRGPTALADVPSALQVVTSQEIERSGASSLPDALRLANNLNVAQKNGDTWGISARGFNTELANKLLVMIDGRTVYTPLFSGVRWDVQDYLLEDINQIEVISGPGGALWGANAVNGVINVTTKSAKETQGFYGEVGVGNQLEEFSSLRYGGQLAKDVYFRVYAKQTKRDDEAFASGADAGDSSRMNQGGFRMDAQTSTDGALTVQGDYYLGHEGLPRAGDAKVAGGNLLSRWSQVLANGSEVRIQLYYDRTFLRQPFAAGRFGPAGSFTENLDTYDLDFQQSITPTEKHKLVWGVGYRFTNDRTKDAPTLGFNPNDVTHELFSAFAQDQFTLAKKTLLTLGTKLEHNDYTGTEIEPNIRLQQDLNNNGLIWGAISRAVRTPSRIDHDIREPSRGLTILAGGPQFQSETVVAYEAGYRAQIGPSAYGSVSIFYNQYDRIRSLSATPLTFFPLYFSNNLTGETHGLELSMNYDLRKWWRLEGGYTLLNSNIHVRPGGTDLNNALNENSDPQNQISLGSSMDLPGRIEFDTHLRWVDKLINNNNGQPGLVPSYTELSVRLGIHLSDHMEFSIVGENLLHDQHPEFGIDNVDRVEIRRSVFAKIEWRY